MGFLSDILTSVTDEIGLTDTGAPDRAIGVQQEAADKANKTLKDIYEESKGRFSPYLNRGGQAFDDVSEFARNYEGFSQEESPLRGHSGQFTMEDFQADPGYQFMMDEGAKAIERSSAAKGSLNSGGTLKALTKYGQGLASQEYGNAYNRFNQDYGNAYNRYNQDQSNKFNYKNTIANYGQNAANSLAGQGMNYAGQVGQNQIGMGNAIATAEMNRGNDLKDLWKMGIEGGTAIATGGASTLRPKTGSTTLRPKT